MCLLTVQPAGTVWTAEHIADFYSRNRDGVGVMWNDGKELSYHKIVPKTVADVQEFFATYVQGKACAFHFRMRTHGDTDLDNCHPYPVFGFDEPHEMPMAMMHNGILHTGNAKDTSKSDTFHYIEDYIKVMIKADPSLAFSPEFDAVIGKHIGSNRFVIMSHESVAIINKSQGVEFNGAWLSNTYAWSADKYLPRPKPTYHAPSNNSHWGDWDYKTKTYVKPAPGKSQPKKMGKTASMSTPNGGRMLTRQTNLLTNQEKNAVNSVSVDCEHLDDILDMRMMLDSYYLGNGTSNKQLECMIEEIGVVKTYFAIELLGDELMTLKAWDTLCCSRVEMRHFAGTPVDTWYADRKKAVAT